MEILQTIPDQHGAFDYAELERLGIAPEDIIDFSVNSNPFGPSTQVVEALQQTPVHVYPDRESLALRQLLAEQLHVEIQNIIVGNGAAELVWLVAFAYLQPGNEVLILSPTFGEYARSARLMGAKVIELKSEVHHDFVYDRHEVQRALQQHQPKLVFLCNPNNPTGAVIPVRTIQEWARHAPDTLFVVDEAYLQFVDGMQSATNIQLPNMLAIRSLTKDYALAGLRIGYAVGASKIITALEKSRLPWSVNALAQAAAHVAIQDEAYLNQTLISLRIAKSQLFEQLSRELKFKCIPSQTHYFLVDVGNGHQFRQKLMQQYIQVRDCASFGLPEYVRIATRTPQENQKLIEALHGLT